jgi:hypothetical protein
VTSSLRPECVDAPGRPALSNDTALYLIRDSVARRRSLIFGRLHDGRGGHCAMGCFWQDNPRAVVNASLVEEVAAVNDSLPKTATPHDRWKKVNGWAGSGGKFKCWREGRGDDIRTDLDHLR